jgi:hypothetical protein
MRVPIPLDLPHGLEPVAPARSVAQKETAPEGAVSSDFIQLNAP